MSTRDRILSLVSGYLVLVLFSAVPAEAQAPSSKLDSALTAARPGAGTDRVGVIVRMQPGHRGDVARQQREDGQNVKAEHTLIDAISMEVTAGKLASLSRNPNESLK